MELLSVEWTLAIEVATLRHTRRLDFWMRVQGGSEGGVGAMVRREKEALAENEISLSAEQMVELWALTETSGLMERNLDTEWACSPDDIDFNITLTCQDGTRTRAWAQHCEFFGPEGPDSKGIMALVFALRKAAGLGGNALNM